MKNLDARLSLVFREIKDMTCYLEKENQQNKVGGIRSAIKYLRQDIENIAKINDSNTEFFKEYKLSINTIEAEGYRRACLEVLEMFDRYNDEFFG